MTINLFGRLVNLHARIGNNFIDANVLDRTGKPEDAAVDKILKLAEEGKITLLLPYSVQREIARSNTPADVKRRAGRLIFSMEVQLTPQENATHKRIRELVQGNAKAGQHAADAFHIVESAKNGGRHFITNDQRLLKKAHEIWDALLIRVVSPTDFVADYLPDVEPSE
jgi:predicted nucleic acid-binding protein